MFFTITADDTQIVFWRGWAKPRIFLQFARSEVDGISPTINQEAFRTSGGLLFSIESEGKLSELAVIVLGRGAFGAFPRRQSELRQLSKDLLLSKKI
ncbi:hypothetical protein D4765_18335 [Subtercola vilae]|uniref:Uncharacterized protein n=1 Tax=Subtercola vilae TaxID=2056433 RepID=A0A4T2BFX0_9MICO|nr:hypothetical protein D4765_18335 [Subtercola vilae]